MKHIFLIIVLLFSINSSYSQIEFGIKAGLSSYNIDDKFSEITDNNYKISIQNAEYGHHAGVYTRIKVAAIYVEPAILFNSFKVNYKIDQFGEAGFVDLLKSERYNYVDIPLLIGFKLGPLRIQGGAISHLFINSISDIVDVDGYEQKFKSATYGYQTGLGLDIKNIRVDVNYEGNLTAFGDHISIHGQEYAFANRPSRIVASVGYKF